MTGSAPRKRGRVFEKQVCDYFDMQHLGRPHEPDGVSGTLVCEAKNLSGPGTVSGRWIDKIKAEAKRYPGREWIVVVRRKGSPQFTVTMDGEFARRLLLQAGYVQERLPDHEEGV